jgi:multidrug transporter EmrE-like cation transporter
MHLWLSILLAGGFQVVGSLNLHQKDLHLTLKPTVHTVQKGVTAYEFLWTYRDLPASTTVEVVYTHDDGTITVKTHEIATTAGEEGAFRVGITNLLLQKDRIKKITYRWKAGTRTLAEGVLIQ